MEASSNQQQKEKEPRVHRPYAFDKVPYFSRAENKSLPCRGATKRVRLKRRLGILTERK